ncbi:MAG: pilus assembly protein TadG-related protein [Dehalococcoidia bacterium]
MMKARSPRTPLPRGENGQIVPILGLFMVAMLAIIGLAIDLGRIYIEKAELSRALDAAALAGTLELPDTALAETKAQEYLGENMPEAIFLPPIIDVPNQKVTIRASSEVDMLFLRMVGIFSVDVAAEAQAGASNFDTALPLDVVILLDDTGTMGSGCSTTQRTTPGADQTGCPIGLTRNAAKAFLNVLAQGGTLPASTNVGFLSFRGCYADTNINPKNEPAPPSWNTLRGCVKYSDTIALSNSISAISAKIDTMQAAGGYPGTNLCLGLARTYKTITGTGSRPDARKVMVILTDGENRYSDDSFHNNSVSTATGNRQVGNPVPNTYPTTNAVPQTNGSPPADSTVNSCYPEPSNQNSSNYGSDYDGRINNLDLRTLAQTDAMKDENIEIFVVGYGVNGSADPGTTCDTAMRARVGTYSARQTTGSSDNQGDRELAKCTASSKSGSNDHYYETNISGLDDIFVAIAETISYRLLK